MYHAWPSHANFHRPEHRAPISMKPSMHWQVFSPGASLFVLFVEHSAYSTQSSVLLHTWFGPVKKTKLAPTQLNSQIPTFFNALLASTIHWVTIVAAKTVISNTGATFDLLTGHARSALDRVAFGLIVAFSHGRWKLGKYWLLIKRCTIWHCSLFAILQCAWAIIT